MQWEIDPDALAKAKEILGIRLPVMIRVINRENSTDTMSGKYHGISHWGVTSSERLPEPTHHISLGESLSLHTANRTAWHELTHAAQSEDFLPEEGRDGLEPYEIANKGMRMAFARELRRLGKTYSYDVSFEREAVYFMKNADGLQIIVPVETEDKDEDKKKDEKKSTTTTTTYVKKDYRKTYRVDMWADKADGGYFVGTTYVKAMSETDAKSWARKEHMKGLKYSSDMIATEIFDEDEVADDIEEDDFATSFYDGYTDDWSGGTV